MTFPVYKREHAALGAPIAPIDQVLDVGHMPAPAAGGARREKRQNETVSVPWFLSSVKPICAPCWPRSSHVIRWIEPHRRAAVVRLRASDRQGRGL